LTLTLRKAIGYTREASVMLKIGEAAALYGVSNRTLRFWEDAGLLKSSRMENDYRYYDAQNLKRIEQILLRSGNCW
jgi:DNA-binding transcriptional MerR regulator